MYWLGPMTREELREAIVRPAEICGVDIEGVLVERLIDDVIGRSGVLPLMQYTLRELWRASQDRNITLEQYLGIGTFSGALDKRANSVFCSFSIEEQGFCKALFIRLTNFDSGPETKSRVRCSDILPQGALGQRFLAVIEKLIHERLIVSSGSGELSSREMLLEVAHEALLTNWTLLHSWIRDERSEILELNRLYDDSREWETRRKDDSYLYIGSRLNRVVEIFSRKKESVGKLEAEFIFACIDQKFSRYTELSPQAAVDSLEGFAGFGADLLPLVKGCAQRGEKGRLNAVLLYVFLYRSLDDIDFVNLVKEATTHHLGYLCLVIEDYILAVPDEIALALKAEWAAVYRDSTAGINVGLILLRLFNESIGVNQREAMIEELVVDVVRSVMSDPITFPNWVSTIQPIGHIAVERLLYHLRSEGKDVRRVAADLVKEIYATDRRVLFAAILAVRQEEFGRIWYSVQNLKARDRMAFQRDLENLEIQDEADKVRKGICLSKVGELGALLDCLGEEQEPETEARMIDAISNFDVPVSHLHSAFLSDEIPSEKIAPFLLCLGEASHDRSSRGFLLSVDRVLEIFATDRDSFVHGAARWLLQKWDKDTEIEAVERSLAGNRISSSNWYINEIGMTMITVPGCDNFTMGSPLGEVGRTEEEGLTRVSVGRFEVSAFPVSVNQFQSMCFETGYSEHSYASRYAPEESCPQIGVTLFEALRFCSWLDTKTSMSGVASVSFEEGDAVVDLNLQGYRLPIEAEWEYACRANTQTSRFFGDSEKKLDRYGWYINNSKDRTWPVGTLKPNRFGLFDVLGNVWEWTLDAYGERRQNCTQGRRIVIDQQSPRILKGGAFYYPPEVLRCANRGKNPPTYRVDDCGFRVFASI